jgi:hypothetical protein
LDGELVNGRGEHVHVRLLELVKKPIQLIVSAGNLRRELDKKCSLLRSSLQAPAAIWTSFQLLQSPNWERYHQLIEN